MASHASFQSSDEARHMSIAKEIYLRNAGLQRKGAPEPPPTTPSESGKGSGHYRKINEVRV